MDIYIYFKFLLKILSAFFLCLTLELILINFFKKTKTFQPIRIDGPSTHQIKTGTPTFGGVGMVLSLIFASILYPFKNFDYFFLLFSSLSFSFIGFIDDLLLIFKIGKRGFVGRYKLILQIITAVFLVSSFLKIANLNASQYLGNFLFLIFIFIATVNSFNLVDGLDGLAGGVSLPIFGAFLYLSLKAGNLNSAYFSIVMIVIVLAFLIFNTHPAKIFMGDTGSHFLGGAIAGLAIVLNKEFLLAIIGGVLVAEAISVILQVGFYKFFKKRFLKMAPLHHHFELLGWPEQKVVYTFWGISFLLAFLGILLEKFYKIF